jgi:diguanylate cyclase (GGDEF)-like protein
MADEVDNAVLGRRPDTRDREVAGRTPWTPAQRRGMHIAFLVGGLELAWLGLHALDRLGPLSDLTFVVLALVAATSVAVGVRRWRPSPQWPCWLSIGALLLFLVSGYARMSLGTLGDLTDHRSLLPDVLAIPGYVLLAAAGLGFVHFRSRARQRDVDAVLDASLAGLAALALAWVYLITPALADHDVPLSVRVLLACYPPLSVFLIVIVARIAFGSGMTEVLSLRLFVLALICMLIGDVIYMLVDTHLVSVPSQYVDLGYALAFVAATVAVLHPSLHYVNQPLPPRRAAPRPARLAAVAVALCVPAAVILTRTDSDLTGRSVLALIVVALTVIAVWRMYRALREHAESVDRLGYQATHDALTSLPNRVFVESYLQNLLSDRNAGVAVLFVDIDRFKLVNDSLGHSMGDELLVSVSERLLSTTRPGDVVARVGGDDFVVIVDQVSDVAAAIEVAERTRLSLVEPFRVRDAEIPVSASVGVSYREPGAFLLAETMYRDADVAMYRAKDRGGNAVILFDESMREGVAERLAIERELRHALERGELCLHYQPIITTHTGRVAGFEALLRWTHPTFGSMRPDVFIPIAEDTGLIVEVGAWVLEEACKELHRIRSEVEHGEDLWMAVNLSTRQLRDDSLLDVVARSLVRNQLPASALCLELTESELMENIDASTRLLSMVRSFGARVAIDDFGTGYSSFAYLRELPVDEIKIDRSFVSHLGDGGTDKSMVAAIVALAASLGLSIVAEGVETAQQAEALQSLGCEQAQGYLYSPAVPANEVEPVLRRLGATSEPRMRVVPDSA